jgi:hypothetical protein
MNIEQFYSEVVSSAKKLVHHSLVVLDNDLSTLDRLILFFFLTLGPLHDCLNKLKCCVMVVWVILESRSSCIHLLLLNLGRSLVDYSVNYSAHPLLNHLYHFLVILTVQ